MATSASLKVMLPFISTKAQIWFAGSATATGDVSHNSRWGKVIGWRRASPLSNRCLKSARLSSDMGSARLAEARPKRATFQTLSTALSEAWSKKPMFRWQFDKVSDQESDQDSPKFFSRRV